MYRSACPLGFFALALFGVGLPNAGAGTTPAAPQHHIPVPSLLAHSRHLLYLDCNALQAKIADDPVFSVSLDGFVSPDEALVDAGFADGAFHSAYRLNLKTGTVRQDKWLTRQIRDLGYLKPRDWELSPNRSWILWKDGWLVRNYAVVATPVQQSRQRPRSIFWNLHSMVSVRTAEIAWFPDSRHWVELWSSDRDLPTEAHIYSLNSRQESRTIPIASAHPGPDLAGITADETIVTTRDIDTNDIDEPKSVAVITFRLGAPRRTRHCVVVHAPAGGFVRGMRLSPDGRMIAWMMVSGAHHDTVTVGTTDTRGANWHEIGEETRPNTDEFGAGYVAGWLPGSKSFVICLSPTDRKAGRDDLRQINID